jgi:hypothetical protein
MTPNIKHKTQNTNHKSLDDQHQMLITQGSTLNIKHRIDSVLHYVTTASRETCHLGPPSFLLLLALLAHARMSQRRGHLHINSLGSAQRRFITVCASMWMLYVGFFFARSNLPLDIPLYL